MTNSDHATRKRGQLGMKRGEGVFERGYNVGEQQQHNGQGYHEHCDWIGHGSAYAALQFFGFLAVICQAFQHGLQHASCLTCCDNVAIHASKHGVSSQCNVQGRARFNTPAYRAHHVFSLAGGHAFDDDV